MSEKPRRPMLIDVDEPAQRIDHGWEEFVKRPEAKEPLLGSATLIALGLFVLLIGFFVVESVGWIATILETRPWLGWVAAGVLAIGLILVVWAIWRELAALFAVRRMEDWQAALAEDADDMAKARAAANAYVGMIRSNGIAVGDAREAIRGANSVEQIRNALEDTVMRTLDTRANQLTRSAAFQALGMSAISPSASIDALLFSVRGVRLVRQIARIYGLRPHGLATWALLRRVMSSASLVAVTDITAGVVATALTTNPLTRALVGEAAGAGMATQRMYRLGKMSSAACRLFPRRSGREE